MAFLGRRCTLSSEPLRQLLEHGVIVRAVFLATPSKFAPPIRQLSARRSIPLGRHVATENRQSIDSLCGKYDVPLFALRRPLDAELANLLRELNPDLLILSCFPWLLPRHIAECARMGAINVHPSILPRHRGPDPLFWAFKTGAREWGVTVHRATDAFDAGPILWHSTFDIPDGISGSQLETLAAQKQSEALVHVVDGLSTGQIRECEQDESRASYETYPTTEDLQVRWDWSRRRALNFISGVRSLGYVPLIQTTRGVFEVSHARADEQNQPFHDERWIADDLVVILLRDGPIALKLGDRSDSAKA